MIISDGPNTGPHIGILRFNIFIHRMMEDGSIDPDIIDCVEDFKDNKMAHQGEIHVVGYNKENCIDKVKRLLESLGDKNGKE